MGNEFVVFLANSGSGNLWEQWDGTEEGLSPVHLEEATNCNHTDLLDLHGLQREDCIGTLVTLFFFFANEICLEINFFLICVCVCVCCRCPGLFF